MNTDPNIIILAGGVGPEREISLLSGHALSGSLSLHYQARCIDLTQRCLPSGIDSEKDIIFPIIHGEFGEDGELQALLEAAGFEYCGSDAQSSRLCMHKADAKKRVAQNGVRVPKGLEFQNPEELETHEVLSMLGSELIIKPTDQGSSVSLYLASGADELASKLKLINSGNWLMEERIFGRELTIGILNEDTLGIVEVIPTGGVYDYQRKYTPGTTEYRFPAVIDPDIESEIKDFALKTYKSCGCRDFARVDFMISEDGHAYFLEINTLPGLTSTSLLPKSASSSGYNFDQLSRKLVTPAINRFLGINLDGKTPHAA